MLKFKEIKGSSNVFYGLTEAASPSPSPRISFQLPESDSTIYSGKREISVDTLDLLENEKNLFIHLNLINNKTPFAIIPVNIEIIYNSIM